MYLTRSCLLLIVALGVLDIWSVEGTKHPRTTRPAKTTSTTKKADVVDLEEDKKIYYHPKPQYLTVKPPLLSQLPTVRPSLPPHPAPLYPVPSTNLPHHPPHHQTIGPSRPPLAHLNRPTGSPPSTVGASFHPTLPTGRPTFEPIFGSRPTQYPDGFFSHGTSPRPPSTARPLPQQSILDEFYNRYPDGSYEFRYELPDETVRYERAYFVLYQHQRILVKKGFYSYRLPDKRYHTVYYTSDQFGHNQDSSFSLIRPNLPHSLKVEKTFEDELRTAEDPVTSTPSETTLASE